MCGRFTQTKAREEVIEELGGIELPPLFHRRYNIAPTQRIAIIRQDQSDRGAECIWGFNPARSGKLIINARHETLTERPMFKDLLPSNRCLVPADGFYEWHDRQPYYFQLPDRSIFAFAGLWKEDRCVIITRAADENMHGIHDRMPVICRTGEWRKWLGESAIPIPPEALEMRPVSRRVNSTENEGPDCLAPAEVQTVLSLFPDSD